VLGPYRSGSSAIAGILHHLGVVMGREFWGEYFEPRDLADRLRGWWNEPEMQPTTSAADRAAGLARWLHDMEHDMEKGGPAAVGAKHPLLTLCGPDLQVAWGSDMRFIQACRPLDESIASLARCGWWPGREPEIQAKLAAAAERFFAATPHLRIDFADTLADPAAVVDRIIGLLGIDPGPDRRARAIACVARRSGDGRAA